MQCQNCVCYLFEIWLLSSYFNIKWYLWTIDQHQYPMFSQNVYFWITVLQLMENVCIKTSIISFSTEESKWILNNFWMLTALWNFIVLLHVLHHTKAYQFDHYYHIYYLLNIWPKNIPILLLQHADYMWRSSFIVYAILAFSYMIIVVQEFHGCYMHGNKMFVLVALLARECVDEEL